MLRCALGPAIARAQPKAPQGSCTCLLCRQAGLFTGISLLHAVHVTVKVPTCNAEFPGAHGLQHFAQFLFMRKTSAGGEQCKTRGEQTLPGTNRNPQMLAPASTNAALSSLGRRRSTRRRLRDIAFRRLHMAKAGRTQQNRYGTQTPRIAHSILQGHTWQQDPAARAPQNMFCLRH